jgi:hypothetical protein
MSYRIELFLQNFVSVFLRKRLLGRSSLNGKLILKLILKVYEWIQKV